MRPGRGSPGGAARPGAGTRADPKAGREGGRGRGGAFCLRVGPLRASGLRGLAEQGRVPRPQPGGPLCRSAEPRPFLPRDTLSSGPCRRCSLSPLPTPERVLQSRRQVRSCWTRGGGWERGDAPARRCSLPQGVRELELPRARALACPDA